MAGVGKLVGVLLSKFGDDVGKLTRYSKVTREVLENTPITNTTLSPTLIKKMFQGNDEFVKLVRKLAGDDGTLQVSKQL